MKTSSLSEAAGHAWRRTGLAMLGGAALLMATPEAQAHGIWIEAPAVVAAGAEVAPRIYFGEYHESLREVTGGRLDGRRGAKLKLVGPSGKATPLDLTQNSDHFAATARIGAPGLYDLLAVDTASPVSDLRKYGIGIVKPYFYARREILAFAKGAISERELRDFGGPKLRLDILPVTLHADIRSGALGPTVGEEVVFQVFFDKRPLTDRVAIHVYSPAGWVWEGRLNYQGMDSFTPPWPGLYIVEATYLKKTPGEFEGVAYEAERHRAMLSLSVRDKTE